MVIAGFTYLFMMARNVTHNTMCLSLVRTVNPKGFFIRFITLHNVSETGDTINNNNYEIFVENSKYVCPFVVAMKPLPKHSSRRSN